jgi:hypothetical protein
MPEHPGFLDAKEFEMPDVDGEGQRRTIPIEYREDGPISYIFGVEKSRIRA